MVVGERQWFWGVWWGRRGGGVVGGVALREWPWGVWWGQCRGDVTVGVGFWGVWWWWGWSWALRKRGSTGFGLRCIVAMWPARRLGVWPREGPRAVLRDPPGLRPLYLAIIIIIIVSSISIFNIVNIMMMIISSSSGFSIFNI